MRENRLRNAVLAALASVGTALMATSTAGALQTTTYTNTFNAQTTNPTDTTPNVVYFGEVYNPPPEDFRFDYGYGLPTSTAALAWSANHKSSGNYSNTAVPPGGSVQLSWQFGSSGDLAAFTTDIFPNAVMVTGISFNLMVASGSATDSIGGNGYFQVFTRDAAYDDTVADAANGATITVSDNSGIYNVDDGWEVGNPAYAGSDAGTWESVNIAFSPAVPLQAITFQDYDSGGINGQESLYIDPLSVTYVVPEPASLGLLGIGVPALLMRRRPKVKRGG
ncbi:MAG: PEP-CTERM sorting domain-containing protein [Tepidisphaeraceae bacterium]|jgi:hypothetical protein